MNRRWQITVKRRERGADCGPVRQGGAGGGGRVQSAICVLAKREKSEGEMVVQPEHGVRCGRTRRKLFSDVQHVSLTSHVDHVDQRTNQRVKAIAHAGM